jgi:hypothetical protein
MCCLVLFTPWADLTFPIDPPSPHFHRRVALFKLPGEGHGTGKGGRESHGLGTGPCKKPQLIDTSRGEVEMSSVGVVG